MANFSGQFANLGLKSLKYHEWKMKVAGAVGFEPTIPVLETGALSRTKLRPCGFVERGNCVGMPAFAEAGRL